MPFFRSNNIFAFLIYLSYLFRAQFPFHFQPFLPLPTIYAPFSTLISERLYSNTSIRDS